MIVLFSFRKLPELFLAVALISICGVMSSGESYGQKTGIPTATDSTGGINPVYAARDSVLSYFYTVSGKVEETGKDFVKVNFITDKGLKKGMRLSVFREGEYFYHPVTQEPMGKSEEFNGKVEISEELLSGSARAASGRKIYLCRVISGNPGVGDVVRITSSRTKLAFFQDKLADWSLSEMFYGALKDSGRFEILETYTKSYEPDKLSELARGLGAEAVLMFSTPTEDGTRFLNVKLYWPEDARLFSDIKEVVGADLARELTTDDELIPTDLSRTEPWGSYKLSAGELIAMGDVDGNGIKELVSSDSINIRIYSFEDEPREMWFIKGSASEKHLSIDVLDLNNNGKAEIFVTSLRNFSFDADTADSEIKRKKTEKKMNSFVLEYDPAKGYKRIWDNAPYVFRVNGRALLMQSFTPVKTLTGPVYKAIWKDSRYQTGGALELPSGVNIYGFTYVDWRDSGHLHILAIDDDGYLNLYSGSELIWRSKDSYGKSELSIEGKTQSVANNTKKWFVKGRLVQVKTDRGQEVIAVKRNPFLSRVPGLGHKDADVYSFWWDGTSMDETLIMGGINGTVTDFWVERDKLLLIARPHVLMFLKKSLSGDLAKGRILYYYNLAGK